MKVMRSLVESLVILLISNPDCYSVDLLWSKKALQPLVLLLATLHDLCRTSPALEEVKRDAEVSGFVFDLAKQAAGLLAASRPGDEEDREIKRTKICHYSSEDSLANDIQELAAAHSGEHLLPFSLLVREPGGARPGAVLLRIRRWLADNFSLDYRARLSFLATLLKHWEEFGDSGGSEEVKRSLAVRDDVEALRVLFSQIRGGAKLSRAALVFFVGCFKDMWSKLPFEGQIALRDELFRHRLVGGSRWLFELPSLTLADIRFDETLTTAFNRLTVQGPEAVEAQQGTALAMEERYEQSSFLQIHWCGFLSPQRTLAKIMEEGIRNKGQQAILVGVLWHLTGLASFRYQDDAVSAFSRCTGEKLIQVSPSGATQEKNFKTMMTIICREAGRNPDFVDLRELLSKCCAPNLDSVGSPLASLALDLTSQALLNVSPATITSESLDSLIWKMLDTLDLRDKLKPEEVDLCVGVVDRLLLALQQEVTSSLDSEERRAAISKVVTALGDYVGTSSWVTQLHTWAFLGAASSKLGLDPPLLPFPSSVLHFEETEEGVASYLTDMLFLSRVNARFMDLILKRWPITAAYDKGALRKALVVAMSKVLPTSSPAEAARLVVVLPRQLFTQGLIPSPSKTEGLFSLLLLVEVAQTCLASQQTRPATNQVSYAVCQITLHLKPLLATLETADLVSAFALLCRLVEKGQGTQDGQQLYHLALDFLDMACHRLAGSDVTQELRKTFTEGLTLSLNLLSDADKKSSFRQKIASGNA